MKATVLVDNISQGELSGEWGLSIYIEYGETTVLLDTGSSGLFLKNAAKLGKDINRVDYAVISHAHYDHANGMKAFFETNDKAKFYLREGSRENCYGKLWIFHKYIGLPRKILKTFPERIEFAAGDYELCPGVYLIPHKTEGLSEQGRINNLFIKTGKKFVPDDFAHEQSLVFETEEGLVIFNSCSHGGADVIIREVTETFPGKKIKAMIGGFHLFRRTEEEVREFAKKVLETGIGEVYTGHCTGKAAYKILKEELGDRVHQLHVGLVIE